jgi:hypothetical protein
MKKESKSSAPTMLDKNWVLKRKRRKLPIGPDQSSGKEQSNGKEDNPATSESSRSASAKRMLKTEEGTAQFSSKKKGHDGVSYLLCPIICLWIVYLQSNIYKEGPNRKSTASNIFYFFYISIYLDYFTVDRFVSLEV